MSLQGRTLWIILAVSGVLAARTGCGESPPTPPPGLNQVQLAGWQAYVDLNCASCHGENREGKRSGPPLTGLSAHWSADELVDYLTDPDEAIKADPRLAYKAEKYAIGMPKVSGKSPGYAAQAHEERLEALAEYVLVDIQE
jgi:mono/diheme cytochrome c family protein